MAEVLYLLLQDDKEPHWLEMVSWGASSLGFLVAIGAIAYTVLQYHHNLKVNQFNAEVNRQTFWLETRMMFTEHNDVYMKLQKGGPWYRSDREPADPQDRAKVISYLSLIEHIKLMLDKGLIDPETIDATQIPYRVRLILQNGQIKRCLIHGEQPDEKPDWKLFKDLVEDFHKRYATDHNFNYREMLKSRYGGGPQTALRDLDERERENYDVDGQEEEPRELTKRVALRLAHPYVGV